MSADTAIGYHYSIDRREIMVEMDGASTIVIEQCPITSLSAKIPLRTIFHVVKEENNWLIDFLSWAYIPKNEDIEKLNKALE